MGASSLWTLSGLAPANLLVLVLDDGAYSITGGQELVGAGAFRSVAGAFPGVAASRPDTPRASPTPCARSRVRASCSRASRSANGPGRARS